MPDKSFLVFLFFFACPVTFSEISKGTSILRFQGQLSEITLFSIFQLNANNTSVMYSKRKEVGNQIQKNIYLLVLLVITYLLNK